MLKAGMTISVPTGKPGRPKNATIIMETDGRNKRRGGKWFLRFSDGTTAHAFGDEMIEVANNESLPIVVAEKPKILKFPRQGRPVGIRKEKNLRVQAWKWFDIFYRTMRFDRLNELIPHIERDAGIKFPRYNGVPNNFYNYHSRYCRENNIEPWACKTSSHLMRQGAVMSKNGKALERIVRAAAR